MKTYKHKLTGETLKAEKNIEIECFGEIVGGVQFKNEKGEQRVLSNRQIERMLEELNN
jgi:hypothetical protein